MAIRVHSGFLPTAPGPLPSAGVFVSPAEGRRPTAPPGRFPSVLFRVSFKGLPHPISASPLLRGLAPPVPSVSSVIRSQTWRRDPCRGRLGLGIPEPAVGRPPSPFRDASGVRDRASGRRCSGPSLRLCVSAGKSSGRANRRIRTHGSRAATAGGRLDRGWEQAHPLRTFAALVSAFSPTLAARPTGPEESPIHGASVRAKAAADAARTPGRSRAIRRFCSGFPSKACLIRSPLLRFSAAIPLPRPQPLPPPTT